MPEQLQTLSVYYAGRWRILNATHQRAARNETRVHLRPSIMGTDTVSKYLPAGASPGLGKWDGQGRKGVRIGVGGVSLSNRDRV